MRLPSARDSTAWRDCAVIRFSRPMLSPGPQGLRDTVTPSRSNSGSNGDMPMTLRLARSGLQRGRRGVLLGELPRDVDTALERDVVELLCVVDEPGQGVRTSRVAAYPGVRSDRHHAPQVVAVRPEPVQGRLGGQEEVVRVSEPRADDVPRVVDDERVGNDEVRPARGPGPVRQVVVVAVGVVLEPAFLDHELAGVRGHLAAVPADGPGARRRLDRRDRALDRLSLLVARHLEVVAPPVAMASGLVTPAGELGRDLGVALQRYGCGEKGDRDTGVVKDPEQPPDACARAVLVHGLHGEVALPLERERQLVEDVVDVVAHRERLLRALFVVDDELDRDLRLTVRAVRSAPPDAWGMLAVAGDFPRRPGDLGVGAAEERVIRHRGLLRS